MAKKIDDLYVKIGGDSSGLTKEVVKSEQALSVFDKSVEDLNRSTVAASASSDRLQRKTKQLGDSFRRQVSKVNTFKRSVVNASRSMSSFGKSATMSVSVPLGLIAAASVRSAASLEESFIKINTLVGISRDVINGYKQDIERLSSITAKPQEELAEALFVVTSAGLRGAEAMEVLEASARSGVIGLGETKVIAKAVTAAMQAYGTETLSASRATDILTAIVREGNLEASELAPVLGRVIGIAAQLGVSFEEVGANIATFTRLGVDSAEAVTGLRGVLSVLLKPSAAAAEALEKVGLSAQMLRKQVREEGLAKTMNNLVSAFKGNEEALTAVIPNVRALAAALGTSGAQAETYEKVLLSIQQSTGLVDKGFDEASKGSMMRFRRSLNDLKDASIELGVNVLPIATKLAKGISSLAKSFSEADTSTKQMVTAALALGIALPPLIALMGGLAVAVNAITWPVAATVAAVLALGAASVYVYKNWEAFGDKFDNLWQNIAILAVERIRRIVQFATIASAYILKGFKALGLIDFDLQDDIDSVFDAIIDKINSTKKHAEREFQSFGEFMGDVVGDVKSKLDELLNSFRDTAKAASNLSGVDTTNTKKTLIKNDSIIAIPEFVGFKEYTEALSKLEALKNKFTDSDLFSSELWGGLKNNFKDLRSEFSMLAEATNMSDESFKGWMENIDNLSEDMKARVQQLRDGLNSIVRQLVLDVAGAFGSVIEGIVSGAGKAGDSLRLFLIPFANAMIQAGKLMIAWAAAQKAFFASLIESPATALAVGIGLVAVGSAFKGALSNASSGVGSSGGGFSGGSGGGVLSTNISWQGIEFYLDERGKLNKRN